MHVMLLFIYLFIYFLEQNGQMSSSSNDFEMNGYKLKREGR